MAATFTVEDGTGLAAANAYVEVADVTQYAENHLADATTWTDLTTAVQQYHIRTATRYLDARYGGRWRGTRANDTQALDWPRTGAYDRSGYAIDYESIPGALADACCAFAIESVSADLMPNLDAGGSVRRLKEKLGPLETETEYFGGSTQSTQYRLAARLLADLIEPANQLERA